MSKKKKLRMCQCGCGCTAEATTVDDSGIPVCEKCAEYMVTEEGDVICSRFDVGVICHVCGSAIEWGPIHTAGPGAPNYKYGSCKCGEHAWLDEDRGGWGHYQYMPEE